MKHHKQLEQVWGEEIALLERQNMQLQESLTRMSATADRNAAWARDVERRLRSDGHGVLALDQQLPPDVAVLKRELAQARHEVATLETSLGARLSVRTPLLIMTVCE